MNPGPDTRACTTLDHVYPTPRMGHIRKGTPCACGKRAWAVFPRKRRTSRKVRTP